MRTGIEGSRTVIFSQEKTVWWWCGMMMGAGVMYPATTTWPTPARKAPVSNIRETETHHWVPSMVLAPSCGYFRSLHVLTSVSSTCPLTWRTLSFLTLSTASCGPPPKVRNASLYGKVRQRYETSAIVRYYCAKGFQQRLNPLITCLPGGRWERPQILCIPGKIRDYFNPDKKLQNLLELYLKILFKRGKEKLMI